MNVLIIVALLLLILGGIPQTGWHNYGYAPSGLGLVLLVVVLVLLFR